MLVVANVPRSFTLSPDSTEPTSIFCDLLYNLLYNLSSSKSAAIVVRGVISQRVVLSNIWRIKMHNSELNTVTATPRCFAPLQSWQWPAGRQLPASCKSLGGAGSSGSIDWRTHSSRHCDTRRAHDYTLNGNCRFLATWTPACMLAQVHWDISHTHCSFLASCTPNNNLTYNHSRSIRRVENGINEMKLTLRCTRLQVMSVVVTLSEN